MGVWVCVNRNSNMLWLCYNSKQPVSDIMGVNFSKILKNGLKGGFDSFSMLSGEYWQWPQGQQSLVYILALEELKVYKIYNSSVGYLSATYKVLGLIPNTRGKNIQNILQDIKQDSV